MCESNPSCESAKEGYLNHKRRTQHRLAGDASYHSNNGGKAQLPPAHVCFPEEKTLSKKGQKALLQKPASQLSVYPTRQDPIAKR